MSVTYWGICGYGVKLNDIYKHINKEKVNKIVRELNPNDSFDGDVFDDDTFCGNPYSGIGELLCDIGHDKIFYHDTDGDCEEYFLYPPKFPWHRHGNDPKTLEETKDRMVAILKRIYTLSDEELKEKIAYYDTVGWG